MKRVSFAFFLLLVIVSVSCHKNEAPEVEVDLEHEIVFPLSHDDAILFLEEKIDAYFYVWMSNKLLPASFNPIDSWTYKDVTSPDYEYWLFVIDLNPAMESGDHFLYVFLNPIDGLYVQTRCSGIPLDSQEWISCIKHPVIPAQTSFYETRSLPGGISSNPNSNLWAVIVNGGYNASNNNQRYWNDCSDFYNVLLDAGYDKNHIFVLMSDGLSTGADMLTYSGIIVDSDKDLDGDGDDDIDYSATKSNLTSVFSELATVLGEGDQLIVFVSDHGGVYSGIGQCSSACLWNAEILYDYEFASFISAIDSSVRILVILGQCHSGGFIDDINRTNITVLASCRYDESGYAFNYNGIYPHSEFPYRVTSAIRGYDDNNSINFSHLYDEVTASEAFAYADSVVRSKTSYQHPQYYSSPSKIGKHYGVSSNYLCNPFIQGPQNISTSHSGYYVLKDLPDGASISWSSSQYISRTVVNDSTILASHTYPGAYLSGGWVNASFNNNGVTESKSVTSISLWHTGNIEDSNMITGGYDGREGYFSLPYNIAGNNSYYWSASVGTPSYQGYYLTDFLAPYSVDPPYTVYVQMMNPLGEYTTIYKTFYD